MVDAEKGPRIHCPVQLSWCVRKSIHLSKGSIKHHSHKHNSAEHNNPSLRSLCKHTPGIRSVNTPSLDGYYSSCKRGDLSRQSRPGGSVRSHNFRKSSGCYQFVSLCNVHRNL